MLYKAQEEMNSMRFSDLFVLTTLRQALVPIKQSLEDLLFTLKDTEFAYFILGGTGVPMPSAIRDGKGREGGQGATSDVPTYSYISPLELAALGFAALVSVIVDPCHHGSEWDGEDRRQNATLEKVYEQERRERVKETL